MKHLPPPSAGLPVALTLAGSDSGAGAGIQADLLTFAALGVYGTTAITCITAQNPESVCAVHPVPPDIVAAQLSQVATYFPLQALKTGMLFDVGIIRATADFLSRFPKVPSVIDPVMVATSGAVLLRQDAIEALCQDLLPRATLLTPNLDEAAVLLGYRPDTPEAMASAAQALCARFGTAILLKGGHLAGEDLLDLFCSAAGTCQTFHARRAPATNSHGSGCTLSAAITAHLALGHALPEAVSLAHAWLQQALHRPLLLHPPHLPVPQAFINHFPN